MGDQPEKDPLQSTKFGFLYPRGHVLVAFKDKTDAERARAGLVEGGYAQGEVGFDFVLADKFDRLSIHHLRNQPA